jgi:hypothetical protein
MISRYGIGMAFERGAGRMQTGRWLTSFAIGGGVLATGGVGFGIHRSLADDPYVSPSTQWILTGILAASGGAGGAAAGTILATCAPMPLHAAGKGLLLSELKQMSRALSGDVPDGLNGLRDDTLRIIVQSQSRMRNGTGPGYRNYANYADLAQARANVQFIREMRGAE